MSTNFTDKILWTVSMAESQLLQHAQDMGATGVAIRTSNAGLAQSIARFHAKGLKVYGWRWPARRQATTPPNYYAIDQANFVLSTLIPAGLDGYFADIESDNDKAANDWDDGDNSQVAKDFCAIIKTAPAGFAFALTSGAAQPTNNRHIPWKTFVDASDYLLAQSYWRMTDNQGQKQDIHGGTPQKAIAVADHSWAAVANGRAVVPMIGEVDTVTAQEIADFGSVLKARGEKRLHVYADGAGVGATQLAAIKAL